MNQLVSLALGNALLGLILVVVLTYLAERWRAVGVRVITVAGMILGVVIATSARDGLLWRSIQLGPDEGLLCGVAIAGMWALIGRQKHPSSGGLLALSAAGLLFAVGADWLVPQLLFYLCFFWAVAAAGAKDLSPWDLWRPLLALVFLVGGSLLSWVDSNEWTVPENMEVLARSLSFLGAVLAILQLPFGPDRRRGVGAGAPLLTAAGFSILSSLADGAPYQGAIFLAAAVLVAVASWLRRRPEMAASAVPALSLAGATLLVPEVGAVAAVAAILIASAEGIGRAAGDPFRGALVALAPITVGSAALGLAAETVLARVGTAPDATGWAVSAALLPAAVAGSLWVGLKAGRSEELEPPRQVGSTAAALAVSLLLFVFAEPLTGVEPLGSGGGSVVLILMAILAGVAATIFVALRVPTPGEVATFQALPESHTQAEGSVLLSGPPLSRAAGAFAVFLGSVALVMVGWLTFQGLKVGFL